MVSSRHSRLPSACALSGEKLLVSWPFWLDLLRRLALVLLAAAVRYSPMRRTPLQLGGAIRFAPHRQYDDGHVFRVFSQQQLQGLAHLPAARTCPSRNPACPTPPVRRSLGIGGFGDSPAHRLSCRDAHQRGLEQGGMRQIFWKSFGLQQQPARVALAVEGGWRGL